MLPSVCPMMGQALGSIADLSFGLVSFTATWVMCHKGLYQSKPQCRHYFISQLAKSSIEALFSVKISSHFPPKISRTFFAQIVGKPLWELWM